MSIFPFTLNPSSLSFSLTVLNFALPQLKQMKELEQEKDTLLAGLEVVERARDWYQGQIHNVTERQRQIGPSSHCTVSSGLLLLGQLWSSCEWIICGRTESVLNDTMCDFRFHSFVYFYYLHIVYILAVLVLFEALGSPQSRDFLVHCRVTQFCKVHTGIDS